MRVPFLIASLVLMGMALATEGPARADDRNAPTLDVRDGVKVVGKFRLNTLLWSQHDQLIDRDIVQNIAAVTVGYSMDKTVRVEVGGGMASRMTTRMIDARTCIATTPAVVGAIHARVVNTPLLQVDFTIQGGTAATPGANLYSGLASLDFDWH